MKKFMIPALVAAFAFAAAPAFAAKGSGDLSIVGANAGGSASTGAKSSNGGSASANAITVNGAGVKVKNNTANATSFDVGSSNTTTDPGKNGKAEGVATTTGGSNANGIEANAEFKFNF